ncbi:MAG: B12-binding domain-containing radical SAM protein [Anaerolineae bacterium]|nr:B12-binding domain-containing radical SAM protein [Anaerolineae bacterium]
MKLLFIQPPGQGDGSTRRPTKQRLFPWGLASVIQYLQNDGHEISVLDVHGADMINPEVEAFLDREKFDAACISGFSSMNYLYVVWLAQQVKKRYAVPVIVGGLVADNHYDLLLNKGHIDICAIGEGELTGVDLFRNLNRPEAVRGIAYRRNGQIVVNEIRELIDNLDSLPMPDFDLWDMHAYTQVKMYVHDESTRAEAYEDLDSVDLDHLRPNISYLAGRGCPYKCRFCSRSYSGVRLKSIGKIIEDIRYLKERFDLKSIQFVDELLILNKKRTLEFCHEMKKLDIYWDGQARVNTINDKEILYALKDANCLSIGLGIESGSNAMLKAMKKGITREQSLSVLKMAREVGIHLKLQFMGGYPGETKATLAETASLIREAKLPPRRLTWTTPLPGSELYEQARTAGKIADEEAYILKLHQGYNNYLIPNIVLNVSGQSDEEMIRLFYWVHMKMEVDYLQTLVREGKLFKPIFRQQYRQASIKVRQYLQLYSPAYQKAQRGAQIIRQTLSSLYWGIRKHLRPLKRLYQKLKAGR